MGYAISWLAVKDAAPEAVLQQLGLKATGEMAYFGESLFTGCSLPTGWFLLVINQSEHRFVQTNTLAALSAQCDVVACSVEEHVMCCTAELWRGGAQVWRIEHDAQNGMSHIGKSGLLPDAYPAIEERFSEELSQSGGEKSDTDYIFEIPMQTAKTIVGFKYDELGSDDEDFSVFEAQTSSPPASGPVPAQGTKSRWKLW
jgi:hypothetical protein